MFQLVLTLFAVLLTALLVAGGVGFLNPDFGVRRTTTETVITSYRAFDGAASAYRIANGGAQIPASSDLPSASSATGEPWSSLRPYLSGGGTVATVDGAMVPVKGMQWTFRYDANSKGMLCLSSTPGATVRDAVRSGLSVAVSRMDRAYLGSQCGVQGPVDSNGDSPVAVTFYIQTGQ